MQYHFDCVLRLHNKPEHKSLYPWALIEADADGRQLGRDQIPWRWTLFFSATSCVRTDRFEINAPILFDRSKDEVPQIEAKQTIQMKLRPGRFRNGKLYDDEVSLSFFKTGRTIEQIILEVRPLDDLEQTEHCKSWGCPSYTTEVDFIDKKEEDFLYFYLFVKPARFDYYVSLIDLGTIDYALFSVSCVDGFYSDWSPSIRTRRVKVLPRGEEFHLELPDGFEGEPPRLGAVYGAQLLLQRSVTPMGSPVSPFEANEEADEAVSGSAAPAVVDPRLLATLASLKQTAWVIAGLLTFICITLLQKH